MILVYTASKKKIKNNSSYVVVNNEEEFKSFQCYLQDVKTFDGRTQKVIPITDTVRKFNEYPLRDISTTLKKYWPQKNSLITSKRQLGDILQYCLKYPRYHYNNIAKYWKEGKTFAQII